MPTPFTASTTRLMAHNWPALEDTERRGDTTCRIWNVTDLTLVEELPGHDRPAYAVMFSPHGKWLVSTGGDKRVRVWPRPTGDSRTFVGHTSDVYRCDFSADGQWLATSSQDRTVRVWNTITGETTQQFTAAGAPIYAVTFSENGKWLAAAGDDGVARIWRTKDYGLVTAEKLTDDALYAIAFTPEQKQIVAAGADGNLYFLDVQASDGDDGD